MDGTVIARTFLYCFALTICLSQSIGMGQQIQDQARSQELLALEPSLIFRDIEPVIRHESRVQLVLPSFLPYVDKSHPIYARVRSVSNTGYDVLLSNALPCEGANWCLYGSVRGSVEPFVHINAKTVPLKLHKGIRGEFVEAICGTYCTEAYAEWRQDKFYYSIGMKAGKKIQLMKMADSAIDAFPNKP